MKQTAGTGYVSRVTCSDNGSPRFQVLGQDATTGRWAVFVIEFSWKDWMALNEDAYNEREEIAQSRIC